MTCISFTEKFREFYQNESSLFLPIPGYATHGEPFFITKDGNPLNSNKVLGRLATMAGILHPNLKGKMSGKRIRKSAMMNFRKLPAAVTSSTSTSNLAQHMSHSQGTADRFYNLLDIVKERGRTASFIKSTIMGQALEEPSAGSKEQLPSSPGSQHHTSEEEVSSPDPQQHQAEEQEELLIQVKQMLISRFGRTIHKRIMLDNMHIEDFVESLPVRYSLSEVECRDYLLSKLNPIYEEDQSLTSGIPKATHKKKDWETSSLSSVRSMGSSSSRLSSNINEEFAFEGAVKNLAEDKNLKCKHILQALRNHKCCRELGIAPGGKFSDTQLRDKFKTYIRQKKKGFEKHEAFY